MSIRYGLLALLVRQPMYGYQLRQVFEESTGATWPLNIGQVYTTLARLERDGLVDSTDERGQRTYTLTSSGRDEVARWFGTPVQRETHTRDELAIKLAVALAVPGVDVTTVIGRQRTETMRALQEYTRLKQQSPGSDLAWALVLESMVFQAEAEIRWLDHCEARLVRHAAEHAPASAARPTAAPAAARTGEEEVTR